ncbi:MAG: hypothetical protein MI799_03655, partial [Desulfobacterales bacterium]|nr:hypothetical protein [Desulfobacterales bacterium]
YYNLSTINGNLVYFLTKGSLDFSSRGGIAPFLIFKDDSEIISFTNYLESNPQIFANASPGLSAQNAANKLNNKYNRPIHPLDLGKIKNVYDLWKPR